MGDSDLSDIVSKFCSDDDVSFTPFVEGKLRWWFDMIDVNKDAFLSKDDFRLLSERFVQEYKLDETKSRQIEDMLLQGWATYQDKSGEGISKESRRNVIDLQQAMMDGEKISQDDFTDALAQLIQDSPKEANMMLTNMVASFFDVFDQDSDGYISKQEMQTAMRCLGQDEPSVVDVAFSCLDVDKDNRLSREEYVCGWIRFILGQDREHDFIVAFAPQLKDL